MNTNFTSNGWADYQFWIENDLEILKKVNDLIKDTKRNFFKGLGKPEALKEDLQGFWSRRINGEHRFVYYIEGKAPNQTVVVVSCRFHYKK